MYNKFKATGERAVLEQKAVQAAAEDALNYGFNIIAVGNPYCKTSKKDIDAGNPDTFFGEKVAKPNGKAWTYVKTTQDIEAITYNYGIITKEPTKDGNYLFIVDFDHVEEQDLARVMDLVKGTVCSQTPHGYHAFFYVTKAQVDQYKLKPAQDILNIKDKTKTCTSIKELVGLTIDIRTQNSYVVAPGSSLYSGETYKWLNSPKDSVIQPAPAYYLQAFALPANKPENVVVTTSKLTGNAWLDAVCDEIRNLPRGAVNEKYNKKAFQVARLCAVKGVDVEVAKAAVFAAADANGHAEARTTGEGAFEAGLACPVVAKPTQVQAVEAAMIKLPNLYKTEDCWASYLGTEGRFEFISNERANTLIYSALKEEYTEVFALTMAFVNSVTSLFAREASRFISKSQFEGESDLVAFNNGCYNITTGDFTSHSPENYIMQTTGYDYDPSAKPNKEWLKVIEDTKRSDPKAPLLLQEWAGYCLTNRHQYNKSFNKFLYLVGAPAGGKSVILGGLEAMLGTGKTGMCGSFDLTDIGTTFGLAKLVGRRVVISGEQSNTKLFKDSGKFCQLVEGDIISVNQKHEKCYDYRNTAKISWGANSLPRVGAGENGIYRRALFLELPTIPKGYRDAMIGIKIANNPNGIFAWALEGLNRLIANGEFTECAVTRRIRREMEFNNNPISDFIEHATEKQGNTAPSALFHAFKAWADEEGIKFVGQQRSFSSKVKKLGYKTKHTNSGDLWCGLSIAPLGNMNRYAKKEEV